MRLHFLGLLLRLDPAERDVAALARVSEANSVAGDGPALPSVDIQLPGGRSAHRRLLLVEARGARPTASVADPGSGVGCERGEGLFLVAGPGALPRRPGTLFVGFGVDLSVRMGSSPGSLPGT